MGDAGLRVALRRGPAVPCDPSRRLAWLAAGVRSRRAARPRPMRGRTAPSGLPAVMRPGANAPRPVAWRLCTGRQVAPRTARDARIARAKANRPGVARFVQHPGQSLTHLPAARRASSEITDVPSAGTGARARMLPVLFKTALEDVESKRQAPRILASHDRRRAGDGESSRCAIESCGRIFRPFINIRT